MSASRSPVGPDRRPRFSTRSRRVPRASIELVSNHHAANQRAVQLLSSISSHAPRSHQNRFPHVQTVVIATIVTQTKESCALGKRPISPRTGEEHGPSATGMEIHGGSGGGATEGMCLLSPSYAWSIDGCVEMGEAHRKSASPREHSSQPPRQ